MSLPIATCTGEIIGGRLILRDRRAFDECIRSLRSGLQVEIEVTRLHATRSLPANRYYWGVVIAALCELTGYTPEEMHEICKQKFIPKTLAVCRNGDVVAEFVMGGSTRGLDQAQFSRYVDDIKSWAGAELDLYIPDADERGYGAGI